MKQKIYNAFDSIRADDALIESTRARLLREIEAQTAQPEAEPRQTRPLFRRALAGAFCALALTIGAVGVHSIRTPVTYIGLDVNPSIELSLNRLDRVIDTYAYNDEGEAILAGTKLRGLSSDAALDLLLEEIERSGYLHNEGIVSLTVQTADSAKEEALCHSLQSVVDSRLAKAQTLPQQVEVYPVTEEVFEGAHGHDLSPAKYLAIQELMEFDEEASFEAYGDASIGQIRQRTQQCMEGHSGSGQTGQSGHHGGMRSSETETPAADEAASSPPETAASESEVQSASKGHKASNSQYAQGSQSAPESHSGPSSQSASESRDAASGQGSSNSQHAEDSQSRQRGSHGHGGRHR